MAAPVPLVDPFAPRPPAPVAPLTDRSDLRRVGTASSPRWSPYPPRADPPSQGEKPDARRGGGRLRGCGGRSPRRGGLVLSSWVLPPPVAEARGHWAVVAPRGEPRAPPASPPGGGAEVAPGTPGPATRSRYLDGAGEVGVIPSVTEPFCDHCDRV